MEAAGGLFVVPPDADPEQVRREVLRAGIRALEVQTSRLEFLAGLPLEFLVLNVPMPPIEPVNGLAALRGLTTSGSWVGHLDIGALPRLEWLAVTELAPGALDGLFEEGHPVLHHLAIGRYREPDLAPLARLAGLSHVSIGDSRKLTSVAGISGLPELRHLHLYICPQLRGLSGLRAAASLRHLQLESCNRITDLEELAALPELRSLQMEMRAPPSLEPLVGHPALAYLWQVGGRKPPGALVDRLLENPRLRFLAISRSVWWRGGAAWEHAPDIYAMGE
jgi:hypothetical protein